MVGWSPEPADFGDREPSVHEAFMQHRHGARMEPLLLAIALWLGFAVGALVGLLATGAVDADPASDQARQG
jgi:hypothetical protein